LGRYARQISAGEISEKVILASGDEVGQLDEAKLEYANVVRLLREVPDSFDERLAGGFSPTLLIDSCLSRIKELSSSK
jgi:hypothetical protein